MKFDSSRAWSRSMAMLGANRELLMVLAGVFFLLPGIAVSLWGPQMPPLTESTEAAVARWSEAFEQEIISHLWLLVPSMLAIIFGFLAMLVLLRGGDRPTVGGALKGGARALLPAVAAYVVFWLGLSVASALLELATRATGGALAVVTLPLLLIGPIYLMVKVSLSGPVIAVERVANPLRVLQRSWRLTRRNSLRLFFFYLLIFIAYLAILVVTGLFMMPLATLLGADHGQLLVAVVSNLVLAAALTVMVAVTAAIHRQLSETDVDAAQIPHG